MLLENEVKPRSAEVRIYEKNKILKLAFFLVDDVVDNVVDSMFLTFFLKTYFFSWSTAWFNKFLISFYLKT